MRRGQRGRRPSPGRSIPARNVLAAAWVRSRKPRGRPGGGRPLLGPRVEIDTSPCPPGRGRRWGVREQCGRMVWCRAALHAPCQGWTSQLARRGDALPHRRSGEGRGHLHPRRGRPGRWKQTGSSRAQSEGGKRAWSPPTVGWGVPGELHSTLDPSPAHSSGGASGTPVPLDREAQLAVTPPGKQGSRRDSGCRATQRRWS